MKYDLKLTIAAGLMIAGAWLSFSPASAGDDSETMRIYQSYCSVCHGDRGDGQSHARQGLVPPPRDFTSPWSVRELTRERIERAIRDGVPGTAMSGWKTRLDTTQIAALAELIERRFVKGQIKNPNPEGGRIYAAYCSVCHGDQGRGALWATAGLSPPPADFTSSSFQSGTSREQMIQSVTYGRPDTAMSGWEPRLNHAQIEAVVDYVINSFMPHFGSAADTGATDSHAGHTHAHVEPGSDIAAYMARPLLAGMIGDQDRGARLYHNNCATCHGDSGNGRGPRAYFINPKPRNFLHPASRAALNRPTLYRVIAKGKLRSEMPAWEKVLEPQQIADVTEYVFRQFIRP